MELSVKKADENERTDRFFDTVSSLYFPNNAGKSNFIRVLSFAANMSSNQKTESTYFLSEIKRNGWDQISNRRSDDSSCSLAWTLELKEDRPVEYTLKANVSKVREENYILEESLNSPESIGENLPPYNYFNCHSEQIGRGLFSTAGLNNTKNNRLNAKVDCKESVLL